MATSTFGKQFVLKRQKADEFVAEMTNVVSPTLRKEFQSKLKYEKDVRENLLKALK